MIREKEFTDTEIGEMPEEWEVKKIKEIDNSEDSVKTGPFGSLLHAYDYVKEGEEGVPLLLVKNFDNGRLIDPDMPKVSVKKVKELPAFFLEKGDIVYSRVGEVGRTFFVTENQEGWMFSGQTLRIRIRNDAINPKFVDFFFQSPRAKYISDNTALGTTRPSINTTILKNRYVPVPPIDEQIAIVKILSDLDSKIELLQKQNETLEAIGQAIFKHWFVDFEFSDEEGKPYKSSGGEMVFNEELGKEIPEGWEVKTIGDVVTVKGGTTPSTKKQEYWDNGTIHWCTPKDLSNLGSPVLLDTERKITNKGLATISSGLLPTGTVLLSSRAPIGYLAISEVPVSINQGFIAILCDKEVSNYYILNWVKFNLGTIKNMAGGSTFQEINKANFRIIKILVPSQDIMRDYNTLLNKMHEGIVLNEKQSRKLVAIRDAILPKLMSGKIRVPVEVE